MLYNSKVYILPFIVLVFSCTKKPNHDPSKEKSDDLNSLITNLDTQEKKEEFLAELFLNDQKVRNPDQELIILRANNYDMNSLPHRDYRRKMRQTDSINFLKVKTYLEIYGYPDFLGSDSKASYGLHAVSLHQSFEKQLILLPYMHKAYINNLIDSERFSFFLNKMYIHKFGKSYPHAISNEENIKQLLENVNSG